MERACGASGPTSENDADGKALNTQKLEAEVRYKNLQAENQELKNAIARGEYLERSEVVGELTRCLMVLKRSLSGVTRHLTTVVAPHVDTTTARLVDKELTELMHDALGQISVNGVYVAHGTRKRQA